MVKLMQRLWSEEAGSGYRRIRSDAGSDSGSGGGNGAVNWRQLEQCFLVRRELNRAVTTYAWWRSFRVEANVRQGLLKLELSIVCIGISGLIPLVLV